MTRRHSPAKVALGRDDSYQVLTGTGALIEEVIQEVLGKNGNRSLRGLSFQTAESLAEKINEKLAARKAAIREATAADRPAPPAPKKRQSEPYRRPRL